MLLAVIVAFCRVVIGLLFALSFAGKIGNVRAFAQTIARFGLLQQWLTLPAAALFMSAELLVIVLLLMGGALLQYGFVLAFALLLAFSVVLSVALHRKLRTSCNCFGTNDKAISRFDLWRNMVFILCALVGFTSMSFLQSAPAALGLSMWSLVSVVAMVFVVLCMQLGEIAQVFLEG